MSFEIFEKGKTTPNDSDRNERFESKINEVIVETPFTMCFGNIGEYAEPTGKL